MSSPSALTVETDRGPVVGVATGEVRRYLGIPYAGPPTAERRYRPPVPPPAWVRPRPAVTYAPASVQIRLGGVVGQLCAPAERQDLNCLVLNVWTRGGSGSSHPVLVWLHGGGFMSGSGAAPIYDGAALAALGIVVVTVNYRLGADGYLLREAGSDCDNLGMRDQLAALDWVQHNIAAFGGDPGRVTLAGGSAGAMGVAALLAVPGIEQRCVRAICQSGAADNTLPVDVAAAVADVYRRAAADADPATFSDGAVRAATEETIRAVASDSGGQRYGLAGRSGMPFQPVHGTSVLPAPPLERIGAGCAAGVDLLVGSNRDDALMRLIEAGIDADPDRAVQTTLEVVAPVREAAGARCFDDTYGIAADPVGAVARIETDRRFRIPAMRLADAHAPHGRTWTYRFDWSSPAIAGRPGAYHFAEVPMVFGTWSDPSCRTLLGGRQGSQVAATMQRAWANFIATGDPNGPGLPDWQAHDPATRPTMTFDTESRIQLDPDAQRRSLWALGG